MKAPSFLASATLSAAVLSTSTFADITNFRDWIDANGVSSNSASNTWHGTFGLDGPLLSVLTNENGTFWAKAGSPDFTPLLALPTTVGSWNGSAGPATFEGSWMHAGASTPPVLVFAPSVTTYAAGMAIRSELIANGLSGNGVTFTVYTQIGGVLSNHGTTTLAGTSSDRTDTFAFGPGVTLAAGDKAMIVFGNNGNYQFDHVNFNAWLTVPAPGALALLGMVGLVGNRRR